MLKIQETPGTNIIEITIEGSANAEQFQAGLEAIDTAIREHGSVRLLEHIGELDTPPIPWSKMWEDIKFGFEHLKDITHVAVVADQKWISIWVKSWRPLFRAKIETFNRSEIEKARQWLKDVG